MPLRHTACMSMMNPLHGLVYCMHSVRCTVRVPLVLYLHPINFGTEIIFQVGRASTVLYLVDYLKFVFSTTL